MTPNERFDQDIKRDVEARVREGVKAVLEEVLQEEMTEHLEAGYRELTPTRRGERNGYYTRNLVALQVRLSALRCRATARASSSRSYSSATRG